MSNIKTSYKAVAAILGAVATTGTTAVTLLETLPGQYHWVAELSSGLTAVLGIITAVYVWLVKNEPAVEAAAADVSGIVKDIEGLKNWQAKAHQALTDLTHKPAEAVHIAEQALHAAEQAVADAKRVAAEAKSDPVKAAEDAVSSATEVVHEATSDAAPTPVADAVQEGESLLENGILSVEKVLAQNKVT